MTGMVKTSSKYLISSVICVGMLQFFDFLAIFGLQKLEFGQIMQTGKNSLLFSVLLLLIFCLSLGRLFRAGFPKLFGPRTLICDSFFHGPQSYVTSIFCPTKSNFRPKNMVFSKKK